MAIPHDVEVTFTLLPTEHGGRSKGVFSGYRPQFYYGNHDWDSAYEFIDFGAGQEVPLGQEVRAFIGFLSPDEHHGKLEVGTAFLIREGNKVVGFGSVRRILELPQSAARIRSYPS